MIDLVPHVCPSVCSVQIYLDGTVITSIIIFLLLVSLLVIRKFNFYKKIRYFLFLLIFISFIYLLINIYTEFGIDQCGNGCSEDGIYLFGEKIGDPNISW